MIFLVPPVAFGFLSLLTVIEWRIKSSHAPSCCCANATSFFVSAIVIPLVRVPLTSTYFVCPFLVQWVVLLAFDFDDVQS